MDAHSKIGELKFFDKKKLTVTDAVKAETKANISELISNGTIKEKDAKKLVMAFESGEISFGTDGLTHDEMLNLDKNTFKNIIKNYEFEKNADERQNKLTNKFLQNGYDAEKDLRSFQKELNRNRGYINTEAGKTHFERIKNSLNTKLANIDTESVLKNYPPKNTDTFGKLKEIDFNKTVEIFAGVDKKIQNPIAHDKNHSPIVNKKKKTETVENKQQNNQNFSAKNNKQVTNHSSNSSASRTADEKASIQTSTTQEVDNTPIITRNKAKITPEKNYSHPNDTKHIRISALEKDKNGRYIIPSGKYEINASEIPAENVKFHLSSGATLALSGDVNAQSTSVENRHYIINVRNGDSTDKVYKDKELEYRADGFYYKGEPIDQSKWDIQTVPIKDAKLDKGKNKYSGISYIYTPKDSRQPKEYKERSLNITGDGQFFAENVLCSINLNCNEFHIGKLGAGNSTLIGSGTVDEIDTKGAVNLTGTDEKIKVGSSQNATINGKNINLQYFASGSFIAADSILNHMAGGDLNAPGTTIKTLEQGMIYQASLIETMNGGKVDLFRGPQEGYDKKLTINKYVAGHVESCDKSKILISQGYSDNNPNLIKKRAGSILPIYPSISTEMKAQGEKPKFEIFLKTFDLEQIYTAKS